jgi:hypothetical protein
MLCKRIPYIIEGVQGIATVVRKKEGYTIQYWIEFTSNTYYFNCLYIQNSNRLFGINSKKYRPTVISIASLFEELSDSKKDKEIRRIK